MPTRIGGGVIGTRIQPGDQAQLFDPGVHVVQQTVADATVEPSDTPSADQLRVQRDGTHTRLWQYDGTDGWVPVQLGGAIQFTVADAAATPAATPAQDEVRIHRDGTRTFLWLYDGADGWRGVEVTA